MKMLIPPKLGDRRYFLCSFSRRACAVAILLLANPLACQTAIAQESTDARRAPLQSSNSNYTSHLGSRAIWPAFPLKVAFVRDTNYRSTRELWARRGFDTWLAATRGFTRYIVVSDPAQAHILVRFDPTTNNGRTLTTFSRRLMKHADVSIGVERSSEDDVACIAAHEFGHALGLNGHSSDARDLMYPDHQMGDAWRITDRDRNTLAALYPALQSGL